MFLTFLDLFFLFAMIGLYRLLIISAKLKIKGKELEIDFSYYIWGGNTDIVSDTIRID